MLNWSTSTDNLLHVLNYRLQQFQPCFRPFIVTLPCQPHFFNHMVPLVDLFFLILLNPGLESRLLLIAIGLPLDRLRCSSVSLTVFGALSFHRNVNPLQTPTDTEKGGSRDGQSLCIISMTLNQGKLAGLCPVLLVLSYSSRNVASNEAIWSLHCFHVTFIWKFLNTTDISAKRVECLTLDLVLRNFGSLSWYSVKSMSTTQSCQIFYLQIGRQNL